jgi:hypothetical protein
MDHHYFRLSLIFTKYNPYELGMTPDIQEVEATSIPADCILFHTSGLTLRRYFYNREQADEAGKEAQKLMKAGTEIELFAAYSRQIQEVMTVK